MAIYATIYGYIYIYIYIYFSNHQYHRGAGPRNPGAHTIGGGAPALAQNDNDATNNDEDDELKLWRELCEKNGEWTTNKGPAAQAWRKALATDEALSKGYAECGKVQTTQRAFKARWMEKKYAAEKAIKDRPWLTI